MYAAGCAAFLARQSDASDIRGSGLYQLPRRRRGELKPIDAQIVADR
jgi:hypothetical protein